MNGKQRSSAVAVIADRTAYDVYDILANGFGYEFTNGWYAQSDLTATGRVYERTKPNPLKRAT